MSLQKERYEVVLELPGDEDTPTAGDIQDVLETWMGMHTGDGRLDVAYNSASADYPATWKEYWHDTAWTAWTNFNETKDWVMDESDATDWDFHSDEFGSSVAEQATEGSREYDFYPRAVIFHADNGFHGEGAERFITHHDLDDPTDMIHHLARAAYFNDLKHFITLIQETRDSLGEAVNLIDEGPLWSDGVEFEYVYEKGLSDPEEFTFTFEHYGGGAWGMFDHNGDHFETISPKAFFHNRPDEDDLNWSIPEVAFELWLDNMCAKRLREI